MRGRILAPRTCGLLGLTLLLLCLGALRLPASAAALTPSVHEFPICTSGSSSYPQISGDTVVWTANRTGATNVYGYDLSIKTEFSVYPSSSLQLYPAISGDIAVWSGDPICAFNLATGTPIATPTDFRWFPAIAGSVVVWEGRLAGTSDIFAYNLSTETTTQVSASGFASKPAISGNTVVWSDTRSGNSDIYGYDLAAKTEFPICTAAGDQSAPAVSDGTVVWSDARSGNSDIYGYDLATKTEFPICTAAGGQGHPAISGNTVVWADSRGADADIYAFDLVSREQFYVCTAKGAQGAPAISADTVVWTDDRAGQSHIYGATLGPLVPAGPEVLTLTSSPVPNVNGWSNAASISFAWTVADPATVAGYSYELADTLAIPDEIVDTTEATALATGWNGTRWFNVRACDAQGVWGPPLALAVKNDLRPPKPDRINVNRRWVYYGKWYGTAITSISGWWRSELYGAGFGTQSGVWYEEVSVEGAPFSATVSIPAPADHSNDGLYHCVLRGVDRAGNVGDYPVDVGIDTAAPTLNVVGADGGWHPDSEIHIAVSDASSGVAAASLAALLDGGPFAIDVASGLRDPIPDGVHVLTLSAKDQVWPANVCPATDFTLKCDSTPPQTRVSGADDAWHAESVKLALEASDNLAGVDSIESRVDEGAWTKGGERTVLAKTDHSNDGAHVVEYRAVDAAGNREAVKSCLVKIDTTPPQTQVSGADDAWHAESVTLAFAASDSLAGVAYTESRLDGGEWTKGDTRTLLAGLDHADDGTHVVAYRAVDAAGNREAAKTCRVRIDTTGPTTISLGKVVAQRGRTATFKYRVNDVSPSGAPLSPTANVEIVIQSAKSETVQRLTLGSRATNTPLAYQWRCTIRKGSYRFLIYAIDEAGNAQAKVGSGRLLVK